jgi:hypothetical protein
MSETTPQSSKPLFPLGRMVATPGALDVLTTAGHTPFEFLRRHQCGDWGDCDKADARENNLSVKQGYRVFSVYHTRNGEKLWVITEADRSSTTVLLPDEY